MKFLDAYNKLNNFNFRPKPLGEFGIILTRSEFIPKQVYNMDSVPKGFYKLNPNDLYTIGVDIPKTEDFSSNDLIQDDWLICEITITNNLLWIS